MVGVGVAVGVGVGRGVAVDLGVDTAVRGKVGGSGRRRCEGGQSGRGGGREYGRGSVPRRAAGCGQQAEQQQSRQAPDPLDTGRN